MIMPSDVFKYVLMGTFKQIHHTADKGFRVRAESLEDLFKTSVKGMAALFREDLYDADPPEGGWAYSRNILVEAGDLTGLLVDFLSEILTLSHIHRVLIMESEIQVLDKTKIEAGIYGIEVDYFDEDIKAVTYHQANIRETKDGRYETVVVFDI